MKFLVTTPLSLLLLDAGAGTLELLRWGDGFYYGLSWNEKGLFLGHAGVDSSVLTTWPHPRSAPRGWLSRYSGDQNADRHACAHLLDPHQVECVDDLVLTVNTGRNCISVYDSETNLLRDVLLGDASWDWPRNGLRTNHFNTVHREGNRVWVIAHNGTRSSELWELSWPELEPIAVHGTGARWAHGIWTGSHGTVVCDSHESCLRDVASPAAIWSSGERDALPRGLSVDEDHIFVGRSMRTDRINRSRTEGGMWVIDRHTLETIEVFVFPGTGGVQDLRRIDGPDECHNGQPFDARFLASVTRPLEVDGARAGQVQAHLRD